MQYGAPPHYTNMAKSLLKERFSLKSSAEGLNLSGQAHFKSQFPLTFISELQHNGQYIFETRID